jgi:hypothetical protein
LRVIIPEQAGVSAAVHLAAGDFARPNADAGGFHTCFIRHGLRSQSVADVRGIRTAYLEIPEMNRFLRILTPACLLIVAMLVLPACETSQAGVKSDYLRQWTTVDADVADTTDAVEEVLNDMELLDVKASHTAIDGQVEAETADDTEIEVAIKKEGDGSEVTVWVGKVGDPELGKEILAAVEDKLAD